MKIYLDTSVLNFAFATETPEHQRVANTLLKAIETGVYDGWISDVVIKESERGEPTAWLSNH